MQWSDPHVGVNRFADAFMFNDEHTVSEQRKERNGILSLRLFPFEVVFLNEHRGPACAFCIIFWGNSMKALVIFLIMKNCFELKCKSHL